MKRLAILLLCAMMAVSTVSVDVKATETETQPPTEEKQPEEKSLEQLRADAFVELYAQVYPETEIIVDVVSEEDIEKMITDQSINYDVYWVEDAYVPLIMENILELDNDTEVPLNKNYIGVLDLVKESYQPLMAKSDIYYALDLDKIEENKASVHSFNNFEDVFNLLGERKKSSLSGFIKSEWTLANGDTIWIFFKTSEETGESYVSGYFIE